MNKPEQLQPADLGELLFAAMAAQNRADALKAAAVKAAKELAAKSDPCICSAYGFPHRKNSGRCDNETREVPRYSTSKLNADEQEALTMFDRAEAMAINAGRY